MKIWIDADACPRTIREVVFRAAKRLRIPVRLVADRELSTPETSLISAVSVGSGADEADNHIVEHLEAGDLVITADIPLAARVVKGGGTGLDPRGDLYTDENVGERLATRDLLYELRSGGLPLGGPAPLGKGDTKKFAAALDRWLTRRLKNP